MRKVYIAGPMTGFDNYNRDAFNAKADELTALGYAVLNPAVLPNGLSQPEYMDICFAMVRVVDMVVFLPGWEKSEGAMAEYHYAKKIKCELVFPENYLNDEWHDDQHAEEVAELTADLSDERGRASYYQNELFKVTQEKNELIAQAASGLEYSTLLHNQIVGNQAAAIASISAQASSIGMRWVINQLTGPGHMNDVFEAIDNGVSAQDFYDKNCLEFLTREKAIEKVKSINKVDTKSGVLNVGVNNKSSHPIRIDTVKGDLVFEIGHGR